jgi:hypothetical protein
MTAQSAPARHARPRHAVGQHRSRLHAAITGALAAFGVVFGVTWDELRDR